MGEVEWWGEASEWREKDMRCERGAAREGRLRSTSAWGLQEGV